MDHNAPPGVDVAIETLLLGLHRGRLTYRAAELALADEDHPDAAARRLAGFDDRAPAGDRLLHSTSWRFADGRIVLTYAALPDPDPRTAPALVPPAVAAIGAEALSPSPPHVDRADVVAHACRHLAFLRHTDPVVAAAAVHQPELWELLDAYRPAVAGSFVSPGGSTGRR